MRTAPGSTESAGVILPGLLAEGSADKTDGAG